MRESHSRAPAGRAGTNRIDKTRIDKTRIDKIRTDEGRPSASHADEGRASTSRASAGRADMGRASAGRAPADRAVAGRAVAGRAPAGRAPAGRAGSAAQTDSVAAAVQRLAVLLEAGVAPRNAWAYLAEPPQASSAPRRPAPTSAVARQQRTVSTIARAVGLGVPCDQAIAAASRGSDTRTARAWLSVAAVWQVAIASGAPIAPCLREIAAALREIGDTQRSIDVALAAPVATARLMTVLPLAALGFGAILGFDTLRTLTTTGPGLFCLVAGVALLVMSRAWNRRLVRVASPKTVVTGLAVELMAVAMAGGASVTRAERLTRQALESFGLMEARGMRDVDSVIDLSQRAGVPAAELLRSEGSQLRREALAASQKVSAALSVRLMIPLGLCVLPAFMLLGVAPLLLSVISSTFAGW